LDWKDFFSGLAWLTALGSLAISFLAYRRAGRENEPILWLELEQFDRQPDWWYVTVRLSNRFPYFLTPTKLKLVGPFRGSVSSYIGPLIGVDGRFTLPKEVWDAPFVVALNEQQLAELTPQLGEGEDHSIEIIINLPYRRWLAGTLKLRLSFREHTADPKTLHYTIRSRIPTNARA
jgi:hypothetical protein